MEKKLPFGGKAVHFKGQDLSLEQLFGKTPVSSTDMIKILWAHIKKESLLK